MIQPDFQPSSEAAPGVPHIRRCTFRRMSLVQRKPAPLYDIACLYPDRVVPMPLGDLDTARPICDSCQASHVFRPDED